MVLSTTELRHRHMRAFKARSFFGFPTSNTDTSTFNTGDNTGDASGNGALQQLLSSQAAQFSSTAFSDVPTQTDSSLQPTDTPSTDSSSDSAALSSASDSVLSTSTSDTPTPTPSNSLPTTASVASNAAAITAMPSIAPPAPTNTQSSANSSTSHKSSHSAAIGVTVTFLILALAVLAFHFIRKRHMARRNSRRMTWIPPVFHAGDHSPGSDMETGGKVGPEFETIDINEKLGPEALPEHFSYPAFPPVTSSPPHSAAAFSMPAAPPPLHPTGYAPPRMPSPPPITTSAADYGRSAPAPVGIDSPFFAGTSAPLVSSTQFAPVAPLNVPRESLTARSMASTAAVGLGLPIQMATGTLVVVARTFVPTLPDELHIQTGEQVRIVSRYDDGWAHVERMRSGAGVESGVVPLECLEAHSPASSSTLGALPGMGMAQIAVEGWRLSKRESSLRGVESPVQRHY